MSFETFEPNTPLAPVLPLSGMSRPSRDPWERTYCLDRAVMWLELTLQLKRNGSSRNLVEAALGSAEWWAKLGGAR